MLLTPRYDGPAILTIEVPPGDRVAAVARQRRRLAAVLGDLDERDWASASRCDGWSVQDVIAHLVGVNAFWQGSVAAGLRGEPTRMLAAFDPAATPPMMVEGMRQFSSGQVLDQFTTSNEAFLEMLDGLSDGDWEDVTAESPAGHVSVRLLSDHALWDSWVHERDVLLPLGLEPAVEPDEVSVCLRYAAGLSPVFLVTADESCEVAYTVIATDPDDRFTVEVTDGVVVRGGAHPTAPVLNGPSVDLVEALSMRAPLPAEAPEQWRTLLGGLATVFDAVESEPAAGTGGA